MKFFEQVKTKIEEAKNGNGFLQLSNQGFNDDDIIKLVPLLAAIESVKALDLSHNSISSEGAQSLATLKFIQSLNLSHNNVGDEAIKELCCNSTIKALDLTCNNIGDQGAKTMVECATQETLLIANNKISPNMAEQVMHKIKK